MIICRGIIYHKISEDFINLFYSLFKNLKDKKKINKFENDFKRFNQSSYCVSYPYARTALMSILSTEKNINRGDEIIISAIQIKGMIDIITNLGLKPKRSVYIHAFDALTYPIMYYDVKSGTPYANVKSASIIEINA